MKDIEKYIKFLAQKTVQIIVQSRMGVKFSTPSNTNPNPKTSVTWFNLNMNDIPEVMVQAKNMLNGGVLTSRLPLYVEISLETVEGYRMVLETWCLKSSSAKWDKTDGIITIYNQMGILLKSLVAVSRVLPAYKISRRQGPESYVICYRMYMGEQQVQKSLGEDSKNICVGKVCTPVGTLDLSVSYRTKMLISPTQTEKDILLKSDHFGEHGDPNGKNHEKENTSSLNDIMKLGAFAHHKEKNLGESIIIPQAPFSRIIKENNSDQGSALPEVNNRDVDNNEQQIQSPTSLETRMDSLTMVSTNDDFIMVDLKTPFAQTTEKSELGKFYREWQRAPPLHAFVDDTPPEELDVAKQLETFESDVNEYDSVVQSFCSSVIES